MSNIKNHKLALLAASSALTIGASNAALLRITVEAPSNVGLAPALVSFHDGSNDFSTPYPMPRPDSRLSPK
jgi:hypothetical protein